MTLITVSTVGYEEIHALSHAGRVFNSFVIFFGVTTMFFAIGAMTQSIIELELGEYFGKRRTRRMIDKLENHFIICGYGRVGRYAATELQAGRGVLRNRGPQSGTCRKGHASGNAGRGRGFHTRLKLCEPFRWSVRAD